MTVITSMPTWLPFCVIAPVAFSVPVMAVAPMTEMDVPSTVCRQRNSCLAARGFAATLVLAFCARRCKRLQRERCIGGRYYNSIIYSVDV